MRINLASIFVDDQEKALKFYVELLLEPNNNPAAKTYQKAIFEQGIPHTAFAVDDIHKEYERLKEQGVVFTMEPTESGPAILAVFNDTCGNLIQLYQV